MAPETGNAALLEQNGGMRKRTFIWHALTDRCINIPPSRERCTCVGSLRRSRERAGWGFADDDLSP